MFKPIEGAPRGPEIMFTVDGRTVRSTEGTTLAIALLEADVAPTRRTAWGEARAPLCLMGACFECLVHVDGRPNLQSCLMKVRAGMSVVRPDGPRKADA